MTGTASVLQTQSGAVQSEITGQQIQNQELNGRNPLYMAQFLPGARSGSTPGRFQLRGRRRPAFPDNGARAQDTMVTFDGAPAVRTRGNGAIIGVASVDATQEMQVITANYAPEYGSAAGGQIRIVTKSGTAALPWRPVRVPPQFGYECQYLDAQPEPLDQVRCALCLQQFRIRRRWAGLDSEGLEFTES